MSASKRMLVVGKLKGKKRGGDSLGSNSFSQQDIRRDFDIPRFRQSEDSTIAAPEEWVEQEIDRKEREDFIRAMQDQAVKDDLIRTDVFVAIFFVFTVIIAACFRNGSPGAVLAALGLILGAFLVGCFMVFLFLLRGVADVARTYSKNVERETRRARRRGESLSRSGFSEAMSEALPYVFTGVLLSRLHRRRRARRKEKS